MILAQTQSLCLAGCTQLNFLHLITSADRVDMNVKLEREREETFGEIFPRSPYHTRLIFTWSYAETCCAFWEIFLIFIYFYDDVKILQFTAHFRFIMKRNFTPTSSPRYNPRNAVDKHYFNLHLKNISSVSFYECAWYMRKTMLSPSFSFIS